MNVAAAAATAACDALSLLLLLRVSNGVSYVWLTRARLIHLNAFATSVRVDDDDSGDSEDGSGSRHGNARFVVMVNS